MLGGIITTPKLISGDGCFPWSYDADLCEKQPYLISATLIASGILTAIQVLRFKLCGGYYLGTGLISVMGPSFAFLPMARAAVQAGIRDPESSGAIAYGQFLGTACVAALLEVGFGLMKPAYIKKVFPPVVAGTAVFLIGAALSGTGLKYWGGGVFCQENDLSRLANSMHLRFHTAPQSCIGDNGGGPKSSPTWSLDADGVPQAGCAGVAPEECRRGVDLPYGSPQFVGLGFLVIAFVILIEMFGAPFMKNCNVVISLMIVYGISALLVYPAPDGNDQYFVTGYWRAQTPVITFLWAETFPLGFDGSLFFPLLIAYCVSTAETVGDIGASNEASGVDPTSEDGMSRVQGGLLADGVNSLLAGLMTTSPNTTFSQNNGVIVITGCASRAAGLAASIWLIIFGMFGKFGGFVADIPACVLGGMALFLFANVMISGIYCLSKIKFNRRNRIILAISLGIGVGVAACPNWAEGGATAGGAFYGSYLKMNMGLWPARDTCTPGTETYISYIPTNQGSNQWGYPSPPSPPSPPPVTVSPPPSPSPSKPPPSPPPGSPSPPPSPIPPPMSPAATPITSGYNYVWVKSCTFDKGKAGVRAGFILLLKTPYCIGTLIAALLNVFLPDDDEEDVIEAKKVDTAEA